MTSSYYVSRRTAVLNVLSEVHGLRVSQIANVTGLDSATVSRQLLVLQKEKKVYRDNPLGKFDTNLYFRYPPPSVVVNDVEIQSHERPAGTSVFKYRDEGAMWERVAGLKRMRARLIDEYHPLLDAVIADYEWMLRRDDDDD